MSNSHTNTERVVIDGVPRVGFFTGGPRAPEDDPFPSCLRAYLEFIGDDLGLGSLFKGDNLWHAVHNYNMGTSGAAFRMTWDPNTWDMSSANLLMADADPLAGFYRAFEAAGYECEIVLRNEFAQELGIVQQDDHDEADFRARIVHSLRDLGRPVIAFGVVGPPECGLITGYDEGGAVMIGWSFFQDDAGFSAGETYEPSGYYRKYDWFKETQGLILIGDPCARPSPREVLRKSLSAALDMMRTPLAEGLWQGQAAFTRWADALLRDTLFPAEEAALIEKRYNYHHALAGTLAEARAWGGDFLQMMAEAVPEVVEDLHEAAHHFSNEHDLVWAMWEFTRDALSGHISSEAGAARFARNATRGRIVPLIRMARDEDAAAAKCIEPALKTLGDDATTTSAGRMTCAILDGVPRIGYDVNMSPFIGALFAIMQYCGDPCDYDYLMGVTGAAFRRLYNRDDGGNIDLMYLHPEPMRRAMHALNYDIYGIRYDHDRMVEAIKDNIARSRPVIGFGIIGPPEAGIIAGYDDNGETVIGWSYFQQQEVDETISLDASGYSRRRDWFARMQHASNQPGLIVVGDKRRWPGPSRRDILIATLKWAIDLERVAHRPDLSEHLSGLAAAEAWADGLEIDADFPLDDAKALDGRVMIHGDQCVMLEERRSAAVFLRMMSEEAGAAAQHLNAAADLYQKVADEMPHIWPWGYDMVAVGSKIADATTRRNIAAHIRIATEYEAQAVQALEGALDALS